MMRSERYVRCSFSPPKTRSLSPLYRVAVWPNGGGGGQTSGAGKQGQKLGKLTHANTGNVAVVVDEGPLMTDEVEA